LLDRGGGTVPADDAAPITYENPDLANGKTAEAAWHAAYNQLELQLDQASFDTWLRPARFLGVDTDSFVVQVHNQYAQEMLQQRLYRNIRRVVRDIANNPALEVRFEITA